VAFQLVNVVRRLLTEGALNAALVPAWLRVRETEGADAAAAFAGRVLGTISAALIAATALIGLLMPLVMTAIAPGFAGHETLQLAVNDARLMLPYLAFAGPATVMMALMSAQARFALTAFSPLLFNIALISVMIVLLGWRQDAHDAALAIAATIGIAGLLQLSILVWRRGDTGIAAPLRIAFDPQMRGFLGKAMPGMIANSGPQLLVVAGAVIASSSPSAVSWLYFANRLIELPLGIVGVAMGTVLVPELTRAVRGGDRESVTHAESRGLELAVGLALPATLGLIVLAEPIVRMLFEHGAFTAADTNATAHALMWLAIGLPAHVLVKALSPAFFARDDTRTPLVATLKGLMVAILLALVLGRLFGADGIAASIALGAWSGALSLIRRGVATFGFSIDAAARRRLPRMVAAALVMGGLMWLAATFLPPAAPLHGFALAVVLVLLIAGGIGFYGLLLALSGVIGWTEAVNAARQSTASDLRD
jgi:putative peptidoglycan lipid II flippase